jgi:hypothetical protein
MPLSYCWCLSRAGDSVVLYLCCWSWNMINDDLTLVWIFPGLGHNRIGDMKTHTQSQANHRVSRMPCTYIPVTGFYFRVVLIGTIWGCWPSRLRRHHFKPRNGSKWPRRFWKKNKKLNWNLSFLTPFIKLCAFFKIYFTFVIYLKTLFDSSDYLVSVVPWAVMMNM